MSRQSRCWKLAQHIGGCGLALCCNGPRIGWRCPQPPNQGAAAASLLPDGFCVQHLKWCHLLLAMPHPAGQDHSPTGKASTWCSIRQLTACTQGAARPTSEFMPAKPLRLSALALGSLASASWLSILPEKQAVSCREQPLMVIEVAACCSFSQLEHQTSNASQISHGQREKSCPKCNLGSSQAHHLPSAAPPLTCHHALYLKIHSTVISLVDWQT